MARSESFIGVTSDAMVRERKDFQSLVKGGYELMDYASIVKHQIGDTDTYLLAFLYGMQPQVPILSKDFYDAGVAYGFNLIPNEAKSDPITPEDFVMVRSMLKTRRREVAGRSFFDHEWYVDKLGEVEPLLQSLLKSERRMFQNLWQSHDFNMGITCGTMMHCVRANPQPFIDKPRVI